MSNAGAGDPSPSFSNALEQLLITIVSGGYRQKERLPAERELALELGTSRSTLREARRTFTW